MKRSEVLALWFLLENGHGKLYDLSDYILQFEEVEEQFASVMEIMGKPNE